ncbi:hypothetical protein DB42_CK00320 [Neochlamydia sp. EPS4]|nr:hypothetical protein DB42_CK00320 [Neochlamydia sp. EPS4]
MLSPLYLFCKSYPALFYGLSFLLGVYGGLGISSSSLFINSLLLTILLLSFAFQQEYKAAVFNFLLFLSAAFYSSLAFQPPQLPEQGVTGTALIHISSLSRKNTFIGKSWNYQGKLLYFTGHESLNIYPNISVIISLLDHAALNRPSANKTYLLQGRLKQSKNGKFIFKPDKYQPWHPLANSWGLAEWRFNAKQAVNQYISQKISKNPNSPSSSFLSGITTGEFENRLMAFEFSRFGLQHIMAISGFHFAIVAGMLGFILSWIVGQKTSVSLLMLFMTLYFAFLGPSPSIIRAWVSCMLGFGATLLEKPPSGLNSLGIGLLIVLIFDPELALHIGFQFSFAVTAAILVSYFSFDYLLQKIFAKKTFNQLMAMNLSNQHGFIVLTLFRQALALSIAVTLAALPLTLYYFQKFPLWSIIYNFFFPWMVSLALMLLLAGLMVGILSSSLAQIIHNFNESFTNFVLDYAYGMPKSLDYNINLLMNQEITILWLGIYFLAGIYGRHYLSQQQKITSQEFIF